MNHDNVFPRQPAVRQSIQQLRILGNADADTPEGQVMLKAADQLEKLQHAPTLARQLAAALSALDACEIAIRGELDAAGPREVRDHPVLRENSRIAGRAHRLLKRYGRRK